jgi:hypothetical protein
MATEVSQCLEEQGVLSYLMSTRSFSATSSKESVCGACSVGDVPPSAGFGWSCLCWCAVCGSFKPHIGGSSSWGEDSSTVGKTVSPIQVSRNTRKVLVVRRIWGRSRGGTYRRNAGWGMAGLGTLEVATWVLPSMNVLGLLITFVSPIQRVEYD